MYEVVVPSSVGYECRVHLSSAGYDCRIYLSYSDIKFNIVIDPSWMTVRIKHSKTDQFGRGVTLSIKKTDCLLSPVAAMLGYLVQRGATPGLLFHFSDGQLLLRDRFVSHMRGGLAAAGIDPTSYAGHSFRIGAATTAANCGLQDS